MFVKKEDNCEKRERGCKSNEADQKADKDYNTTLLFIGMHMELGMQGISTFELIT